MTTYALTVSTNALGLGVISSATVVVERKRTTVTDIYPTSSLYIKKAATNVSGIATIQLEADDGTVFHEVKIFNTTGVLIYKNTIQMPPQAANIEDLPLNDIITESAYQAVQAKADTLTLKNAAQTSATNAANSASAASASETNANNSANAASTSATNAATSADNAATSATNASNSASEASTSATTASNAQTAAEAAKDIAIQAANIYATTALGLAATTNGQYFSVPYSANPVSSFAIYKNNSGSALYVTSLPSSAITQTLRDNQAGQAKYSGTGDYPIVTDTSGFVLISVSKTTGKVTAYGLVDETTAATIAQDRVLYTQALQRTLSFIGTGDDVPVITDSEGKILIGVNKTTGELIADISTTNIESVLALKDHNLGQRKQTGGTVTAVLTDNEGRVLLGFDSENSKIVGAIEATSTSTYTLENLANPIIERQINHFLFYGQSLSVGATGQSAISTTQPYSNITFTGGVKSTKAGGTGWNAGLGGFKPLVEDNIS